MDFTVNVPVPIDVSVELYDNMLEVNVFNTEGISIYNQKSSVYDMIYSYVVETNADEDELIILKRELEDALSLVKLELEKLNETTY